MTQRKLEDFTKSVSPEKVVAEKEEVSSIKDELFNREEDTIFELKEEIPRNFSKHLVALSNSEGGRIIIGVSDNRKIVGVGDVNQLKAQLISTANECSPPIHIGISTRLIDNKEIATVSVPKGEFGIYSCGNKYFIRRNDRSVPMRTKEELLSLMIEKGQTSYGAMPVVYNKKVEFSGNKVARFIKLAKEKRRLEGTTSLSSEDILKNLKCLTTKNNALTPTIAGLLFFTDNPQEILPHTMIKLARFNGKTKSIPIESENIKGTLDELIEASLSFIKRNTMKKIIFKDYKRIEKTEYPMFALREAITNAVAHRDYSSKGQTVRIFVYDDRIEILTPGGLPPPITLDNITESQHSREPVICRLLLYLGYMEELGSGVSRMIEIAESWGLLSPSLQDNGSDFSVTFFNKQVGEDHATFLSGSLIKETDLSMLLPEQIVGIDFVVKENKINKKQYVENTGVSPSTATRHLSQLVKFKILLERGSGKNTFYVLNSE
ncbi:MAG: putative DNA binding domain-containing protein [Nanoarchaeota archaeon]|nr:putative DNA binding domain-containing protein [Nanoarchaeota archaeon]